MAGERSEVKIGATLYDEDGNEVGRVRGFDQDGIYVTTREGIASLSVEHQRSVPEFGEAELVWRCGICGEMGEIADLPDSCPSCGAEREELYYWTED